MNKFFFYAKDAHMMLSSLSFMDEDLAQSQYMYEILKDGTTRASKAEEVCESSNDVASSLHVRWLAYHSRIFSLCQNPPVEPPKSPIPSSTGVCAP